jgi:hypothetical protein
MLLIVTILIRLLYAELVRSTSHMCPDVTITQRVTTRTCTTPRKPIMGTGMVLADFAYVAVFRWLQWLQW